MYRRIQLDFERLTGLVDRGLSDPAVGRLLGCHRETVLNYRHRLGLASHWPRRRANLRARHAELDRLWARLSVAQKTTLLLQRPEAKKEVKSRKSKVEEEKPELSTFNFRPSTVAFEEVV